MAMQSNNLLFLVRQFCDEENLRKTVHMFEQETGCFFDMKYFEGLLLSGDWNEAENYLSGFTGAQDNEYSYKIYLEIRKQKYLEALERHDFSRALDILKTDIKVLAPSNEDFYTELTLLLTMDDFRKHSSFSMYGDMPHARKNLTDQIKVLIEANPKFHYKLESPQIEKSTLLYLANQSFEKLQVRRAYPQPEPQPSRTLSVDTSEPSQSSRMRLCQPYAPNLNTFSSTPNFVNISNQGSSSRGCSTSMDNMMVSHPTNTIQNVNLTSDLLADFPKTVRRNVNLRGDSISMEFHPINETLLLVGICGGEIELWDVSSEVRLFWSAFSIWSRDAISAVSLELGSDPDIRINRVVWSQYGLFFGVALSKHILQLYAYNVKANITRKHLEINAHDGSVNDLAFSSQEQEDKLYVISCGDDKLIQVWDAITGSKQYTLEGHTDSVSSLCPNVKGDYVFSTSRNGEIKAWLYTHGAPKIEYIKPHNSCMRMAYTADGQRLFSCGTNNTGESSIVEWNDTEGYITRIYHGLSRPPVGFVQFSICKSHFLAAGDEHVIKVWSIDNVEILTTIEAEGGLPACPCICFNKTGSLLAVGADYNKVKILANEVGQQMLQTPSPTVNLSRSLQVPVLMGGNAITFMPHRALDSQKYLLTLNILSCRSLRLPSNMKTSKIFRLTYTSTGNEILALAEKGIHILWRWPGTDLNNKGWATTDYAPVIYRPESGLLMINDFINDSSQRVFPFFALSENNSYHFSGSGRQMSLFNTSTFQRLGSYLTPPPTATCVSYYPLDNNIIAVGMDDSSILIFNVRQAEVINRYQGHTKRVSGLAFSTRFTILVSVGVDNQIIVWNFSSSVKMLSTLLEISVDWLPSETAETSVQFFKDQRHILINHESQLVIYDSTDLTCVRKWMGEQLCTRISRATLSSDNQVVYVVLENKKLLIFNAQDLIPSFDIDTSVYLPRNLRYSIYPQAVAENPIKPNQFAIGLSDGRVVVIEPHEFISNWLSVKPGEHGSRINRGIIIQ